MIISPKLTILFSTLAVSFGLLSNQAVADMQVSESEKKAITERIKSVGAVYISSDQVQVSNEPLTPDAIYTRYCSACHGSGLLGAPVYGDKQSWAPHVAKGRATLKEHLLNGFNNMPARGTCNDCTDDELDQVLTYILN